MKLAHSLTNFFIVHTITQTNVHTYSRSTYRRSVNENSYDYNRLFIKYTYHLLSVIFHGYTFKLQTAKRAP
ncbi:hypothetical protein B7L13_28500 [Klebsiella oxytoca]|nr:hypothetical protein B7L13_28500 [Klebsiella oxytoca]TXU89458.1 hypothetical protein D4M90_27175 [Klebsiella oxytoca]